MLTKILFYKRTRLENKETTHDKERFCAYQRVPFCGFWLYLFNLLNWKKISDKRANFVKESQQSMQLKHM